MDRDQANKVCNRLLSTLIEHESAIARFPDHDPRNSTGGGKAKTLETDKFPLFPKSRKRDLSGRANGTIDPFYGCFLLDELIDYAVNFTFPWCKCHSTAWKHADAY